jgi:hypothetical protein
MENLKWLARNQHGGNRVGAGRKKGVPPRVPSKRYLLEQTTARTRAILRKYPPLDVMVFTMNAFVAAAELLGNNIVEVDEQIITRLNLLEHAAHIAKDAAPYIHPRLAQIEHN